MEFQPVWGVELFNLRYNYFCFEPIVIFVFLDFVLYEYRFIQQQSRILSTFWNLEEPFKTTHFSLILRTKNLVNFGTQHMSRPYAIFEINLQRGLRQPTKMFRRAQRAMFTAGARNEGPGCPCMHAPTFMHMHAHLCIHPCTCMLHGGDGQP